MIWLLWWRADAGSTGGVEGGIWEAWAEDEKREKTGDVGWAAEKINEYQVRGEGDQAGKQVLVSGRNSDWGW